MTEKRFTLEEFGDRCVAHDNGRAMNARQVVEFLNAYEDENKQLKQQVQNIHKLINSKIQSARELGNVRTVIALKNLQRELKGDVE